MENAGRILLMPKGDYSASTTYAMLDIVNYSGASWVCKQACTGQTPSDSNTAYWQRLGTAVDLSNYLPLTGGTLTAQHFLPLGLKNANGNNSYMQFEGKDGVLGYLGFESTNVLRLLSSVGGSLGDILHTGNKPTGSYTGNGDATERQISVGGIGNVLAISGNGTFALASAGGIIGHSNGSLFATTGGMFYDGVLFIVSAHEALNANGVQYKYDLL